MKPTTGSKLSQPQIFTIYFLSKYYYQGGIENLLEITVKEDSSSVDLDSRKEQSIPLRLSSEELTLCRLGFFPCKKKFIRQCNR